MASKDQKFNKYDLEFKLKIIKERNEGKSYRYLSEKYNIPQGTIKTWVHKIKQDGALGIKQKGRPKESETNYKERYEILKKFQDFLVKETLNKK